jgi:hypothetical protein
MGLKLAEAQAMLAALKATVTLGGLKGAMSAEVFKEMAKILGGGIGWVARAGVILTVLNIIETTMYFVNEWNGNRGVDVFVGYMGGTVVLPPTVERQQGRWFIDFRIE